MISSKGYLTRKWKPGKQACRQQRLNARRSQITSQRVLLNIRSYSTISSNNSRNTSKHSNLWLQSWLRSAKARSLLLQLTSNWQRWSHLGTLACQFSMNGRQEKIWSSLTLAKISNWITLNQIEKNCIKKQEINSWKKVTIVTFECLLLRHYQLTLAVSYSTPLFWSFRTFWLFFKTKIW